MRDILLPDNAPHEYQNRAILWNAVERVEKAKNSQLAREIEIGIPTELTRLQHNNLIREYVRRTFVEKGMCADICIHDKKDGNPHAHILLTMRPFNENGTWGDKQKKEYTLDRGGNKIYDAKKRQYKCKSIPTTDWNEHTKAEEWRAAWADIANRYLEQTGHAERIDHRSYERQGVEQVPTVHLGVAASAMEKRGIATERGDINREIEVTNRELRQLRARIRKLRDWLKEEAANIEPPTLSDLITGIVQKREQSGRYYAIASLKAAANLLNFLTINGITDMAGLENKVNETYRRFNEVSGNLNTTERRMKTPNEHIKQAEIYHQYKGHKAKYDKLCAEHKAVEKAGGFGSKRKIQKALDAANDYYEAHRMELTLHAAAVRYLQDVQRGHASLPHPDTWKAELAEQTAKRKTLSQQYFTLKEEVKQVETIRRHVEYIMREESRERHPRQRTHELQL